MKSVRLEIEWSRRELTKSKAERDILKNIAANLAKESMRRSRS